MLESAIKISNQTGQLCKQATSTARDEYPCRESPCRYIVAKLPFSPTDLFKRFLTLIPTYIRSWLRFLEFVPNGL